MQMYIPGVEILTPNPTGDSIFSLRQNKKIIIRGLDSLLAGGGEEMERVRKRGERRGEERRE